MVIKINEILKILGFLLFNQFPKEIIIWDADFRILLIWKAICKTEE